MIFEHSIGSTILLQEEPIAGRTQTQNMGFILFMVCFFILIYQVSRNSKLLLAMKGKLFGNRSQTVSSEIFTGQFLNILLFCIQTVLLVSIILYCKAVSEGILQMELSSEMFAFLGLTSLLLGLFIAYKYLTYSFISYIFFDKETKQRWNDTFSSAICVSGVILFFPALILFYAEQIAAYGVYLVLLYFIFIQIVLLYRQFVLFFNKKGGLIYFILYLCTQEIIPLFLLYKGFVYFFNIAKG
ncbi:MAG: DUF4271 domain-containing protein [Dysgonamonadaceae bacterium]|jgi:hypothetical protein|nr:DUF4271 domain-containing protein [Dysgonamonadaceae bacterium]